MIPLVKGAIGKCVPVGRGSLVALAMGFGFTFLGCLLARVSGRLTGLAIAVVLAAFLISCLLQGARRGVVVTVLHGTFFTIGFLACGILNVSVSIRPQFVRNMRFLAPAPLASILIAGALAALGAWGLAKVLSRPIGAIQTGAVSLLDWVRKRLSVGEKIALPASFALLASAAIYSSGIAYRSYEFQLRPTLLFDTIPMSWQQGQAEWAWDIDVNVLPHKSGTQLTRIYFRQSFNDEALRQRLPSHLLLRNLDDGTRRVAATIEANTTLLTGSTHKVILNGELVGVGHTAGDAINESPAALLALPRAALLRVIDSLDHENQLLSDVTVCLSVRTCNRDLLLAAFPSEQRIRYNFYFGGCELLAKDSASSQDKKVLRARINLNSDVAPRSFRIEKCPFTVLDSQLWDVTTTVHAPGRITSASGTPQGRLDFLDFVQDQRKRAPVSIAGNVAFAVNPNPWIQVLGIPIGLFIFGLVLARLSARRNKVPTDGVPGERKGTTPQHEPTTPGTTRGDEGTKVG